MRRAAGSHFRDALDKAPTGAGDLVQRPFERGPRDALPAVPLVDVEAPDPPVRPRWWILLVRPPDGPIPCCSSRLPYLAKPCARPSASNTSAAWARPVRTRSSFAARLSKALLQRWPRGGHSCTSSHRRFHRYARPTPRRRPRWTRRAGERCTAWPPCLSGIRHLIPWWVVADKPVDSPRGRGLRGRCVSGNPPACRQGSSGGISASGPSTHSGTGWRSV